jgi:hypothetical protein
MLRWNPHYLPQAYLATAQNWNGLIRGLGEELGLPVLDVDSLFGGQPSYFTDLVHLTDEGRQLVGSALAIEIERVLTADGLGR